MQKFLLIILGEKCIEIGKIEQCVAKYVTFLIGLGRLQRFVFRRAGGAEWPGALKDVLERSESCMAADYCII